MNLFRFHQKDTYKSFSALLKKEADGVDYHIVLKHRNTPLVVIAPHGGSIEGGTSELAKAIAGNEFSLYCFEGLKKRENKNLHITSTNFDEPRCIELIRSSSIALALHGCDDEEAIAFVGGLDRKGTAFIIDALLKAGLNAIEDTTHHSGKEKTNICNQGKCRKGIQIEISKGLRKQMFRGLSRQERPYTTPMFDTFVRAVQNIAMILNEENQLPV